MKRQSGNYQKLGNLEYFIPNSLPPHNPSFDFNGELIDLYGKAMHALGKLNEMANRLPNIERFVKAYCLKEAILSSAIEGIHTTITQIFTNEISPIFNDKDSANQTKHKKQTQLVLNYNKALDASLKMIQQNNLPIVSRVILEAHKTLMSGGEGEKSDPGNYRKVQVSVGNLIPAPANHIARLISDLEVFINNDNSLPVLIKSGLAHVQFETIHPFLDGNGRIGRLLIVLMLIESKIINAPILYPSTYFKKHHSEYYQRLDAVRTKGDFEGWIRFYLKAITQSANEAYEKSKAIESLEKKLHNKIVGSKNTKKKLAERTLPILFRFPVISITELQNKLSVSYNATNSVVQKLIELNILQLENQQKRNKLFRFSEYLELLEK